MSELPEDRVAGAATLGVVTIGQSPRPDLTGFLREGLAADVEIVEAGALDGLESGELEALASSSGEERYLTRLRSGASFSAPVESCHALMERKLDELASVCDVTLVLCTGDFSDLVPRGPVLYPDRILHGLIGSIVQPGQQIGVILPAPPTEEALLGWRALGVPVRAAFCDPYDGSDPAPIAAQLVAEGASLVVLDCMGFTIEHRKRIREKVDLPVIVPQALLSRVLQEYLAR